jgi:cyanophycin synthetase
LKAQGAAVVEVNAGPSLLMHLNPASGKARQVGEAIAHHLFPSNEAGRIPVVGLMGHNDTTGPAKLIAWLLHLKGLQTGLACACGLFLGNRRLQKKSAMDWETAQRLLINRAAQAAVFESTARHLLTEGLPYDRCQVGVVTACRLLKACKTCMFTPMIKCLALCAPKSMWSCPAVPLCSMHKTLKWLHWLNTAMAK